MESKPKKARAINKTVSDEIDNNNDAERENNQPTDLTNYSSRDSAADDKRIPLVPESALYVTKSLCKSMNDEDGGELRENTRKTNSNACDATVSDMQAMPLSTDISTSSKTVSKAVTQPSHTLDRETVTSGLKPNSRPSFLITDILGPRVPSSSIEPLTSLQQLSPHNAANSVRLKGVEFNHQTISTNSLRRCDRLPSPMEDDKMEEEEDMDDERDEDGDMNGEFILVLLIMVSNIEVVAVVD